MLFVAIMFTCADALQCTVHSCIGAITTGTEGTGPPTFTVPDQPCIAPEFWDPVASRLLENE